MGTTVAVIRVGQSFMGLPEGPITVWDIATGESAVVATGMWEDDVVGAAASGDLVISGFGGVSSFYGVLDANWNRTELCASFGVPTRLSVSPDRTELTCVEPDRSQSLDSPIGLLGVVSTAGGDVDTRAVLPGDYWEYTVGGWLSPTEVLLVRSLDGGEHLYAMVDTASGQVTEPELPVDGAESAVFFDHAAGVFYSQRANSVVFYDRDGQVVAEVMCEVEFDRWDQRLTFSGQRAVVDCASFEDERAPLDLTWVNLETGETASILADVPGGSTRVVLPWLEGRAEG